MFNTILICSDGSEHALKAAEAAVSIAKLHDASVVLLNVEANHGHAITVPWQLDTAGSGSLDKLTGEHKATLDATLDLCRNAGVRFRCRQECGHAGEQIIRVAEDEGADLIVLGPRGVSDWKALMLGSVSDHVLHHARCSVLIVR